ANMSHEIRTPMTAILGFAEFLETEGDVRSAPEQRIDAIRTIRRNGEHLLSIINDILDISKIEAGKLRIEYLHVDPLEIVQEIVDLMQVRAEGKGLDLNLAAHSEIPLFVSTDPVRLRQILTNLIGNAIKFTELGAVTVGVSYHEPRPGEGRLQIDVADTGIGMTEAQALRIFEAFAQGDDSTTRIFGGTGLGLRISRTLAQKLGGDLTVVTSLGEGSVFTLVIDAGDCRDAPRIVPSFSATPVSTPPTEEPPTDWDADSSDALRGLRILLAEDGPDNQRLIRFMLQRAGAEVDIAENGQLAVERFREAVASKHPYDVVLMDMQMPVLDGYAATRQLRSDGWEGPVVALTAHAMSGDRYKCIDAGCSEYATKPIDRLKLIETIHKQLAACLAEP
ncbi:MAG: response regulator, partial [Planctomycetales bacterium]|nr:response regulator [Planctomycetales bacterium]